ncbi:ribbon-helix-helix domain-containing protein [Sporolactobacillus sp. STCC-11]|uniref:ribbon-helix-helix domain-containing protein n=1 Tax=Sporolactobacillus caesalpiniae TaxID=3230362 RepID=UPI003398B221
MTEQLDRKLAELAAAKGIAQAEVIREGLEMYLQSFEDKAQEWADFILQEKQSKVSRSLIL